MSEFELERHGLEGKLGKQDSGFVKEDSNRALLESLKRSTNIAADLSALYQERPYVYARVMKQLTGVLGGSKVRRLHTTVQENARQAQVEAERELAQANRNSLHKKSSSGRASANGGIAAGSSVAEGGSLEKELTLFGVKTKVKYSSENGKHTIECDKWNIPFLKNITGSATVTNSKLSEINLRASLSTDLLKDTNVTLTLKDPKGTGQFKPLGGFSTSLEIPGIDDLKVGFNMTQDGASTVLKGQIATTARIFDTVDVSANGSVSIGESTQIDTTLTAKGNTKRPGGGAAQSGMASDGAMSGSGIGLSGTVTLSALDGEITSATGTLTAKGLNFVTDPSSEVTFKVSHTGDAFEAEMSSVSLKPYTVPGTGATLQLTINEASYTVENQFAASGHVEASLWDAVKAEGDVSFTKNKLENATLTVSADNFSIPGTKAGGEQKSGGEGKKVSPILSGSLTGTVDITEGAFEKASITGNVHLSAAQQTVSLNVDALDIDAQGGVSGELSLGQPFAMGCATLTECNARFDSATDNILTQFDGSIKVDHKNLRSEDPGISIHYAAGVIKCDGIVKVLQNDESEIATSTLDMTVDSESLNATCDIVLSNDLAIPDANSKFKILTGAQAHVAIVDNEIAPLEFSGDFKYGADADSKKGSGGAENAFSFSGNVKGGKYDLSTGSFDGVVSGVIDSDLALGSEKIGVTLPQSYYGAGNELYITFVNSQPTTVKGTITAITDIKLKNDNLKGYITADIKNFDCDKGEFTGKVMAKLTENYDLYKDKGGDSLVLQGKRQCGLNLEIEANKVTGMDLDCVAKLTIANDKFTQKKAVFDLKMQDASIDVDTLAVSGNISAHLDGDVEMNAHNGETKVTVLDGGGLDVVIKDDELQSFDVRGDYEGKTSILKTTTPIVFKGSAGVSVAREGEEYVVSGDADIETVGDCVLDAIEGVDSITLKEGSRFGIVFSNEGISSVSGAFQLDYIYKEAENKYLPEGFGASLKGENLTCTLGDKPSFDGTVKLTPIGDIKFVAGEGGATAEFTLLEKGTSLDAEVADSKLVRFHGDAFFNASAALEGTTNAAKLNIEDGSASVDLNVETGEINSLEITAKVELTANLSDALTVQTRDCTATAQFDSEGLVSSDFSGALDLDVKLPSSDELLTLELASESLAYTRENSFNGVVTLKCASKTKLGDFTYNDKSFEYGLGTAEGPAASVETTISEGKVTYLTGAAGLYLTQTGEDEMGLLKVHGDVEFAYDVENNNLIHASGSVSIEEKKLFNISSTESLWLKPSEATLEIDNSTLTGVRGQVTLEMQDEDGGYLEFKTAGDFDCIDPDKINGTVTVAVTREKAIGKPTSSGYQFVVCKSSGFKCDIEENNITALHGNFAFKIEKDKEELFRGSVEGDYTPGGEDTESDLTASGQVELKRDLAIDPAGKFRLGMGTSAKAEIKNSKITQMDGTLIVIIAGPKTAQGESKGEIRVEAKGSIDVESGVISKFSGNASLEGTGPFELGAGLSLTSLNAHVGIVDNDLNDISGKVGMKYQNKGFTIEGGCDSFRWVKGQKGANDQLAFAGHLSVQAFEGKLGGEVDIDYDTEQNGGAPKINGKLNFKITDWLEGMIGVRFENGWDDPIVYGEMDVNQVELMAGRSLFNFTKDLGFSGQGMAGPVPITFGGGIGLGLNVGIKPILFNATLKVKDYHVRSGKGIPAFSTELQCTSGLELKASIAPYLKLGVGVANVLEAGFKLKGSANFTTAADVTIGGELHGGEEGLGGSLGLGVALTGSFSVDVIPELYAVLLGKDFNYPITTWTFDLGDVFSFNWGKKVVFDAQGTRLEDSGSVNNLPGANKEQTQEAHESKTAEVGEDYKKDDKGKEKKDGPNLPGSQALGSDVGGAKQENADSKGGISEKIEHIKNVGNMMSAFGFFAELIGGLVNACTFGPAGVLIYVLIRVLVDNLIGDVKQALADLKKGFNSLMALFGGMDEFLKLILPPDVYNIYMFLKDADLTKIKNKVMSLMREKFEKKGYPVADLLQPVIDFVGEEFDLLIGIVEAFNQGEIVKGIFKVLGFVASSVKAFFKMCGKILDVIKKLLKAGMAKGDVFVRKDDSWQVKIPGFINWSGDGCGPIDWPISLLVYETLSSWIGLRRT